MAEKRRLFWVLYPSYLLVILISLVAVTWYASASARRFFIRQTELDLESRAYLFENQILPYLNPLDGEMIDSLCKRAGPQSSTRITVILPSGRVIGDSEINPEGMDSHADRPEFRDVLIGPSGSSTRYSITLNKDFMYLGIPVLIDKELRAIIRTSIPVDTIDRQINQIQRRIMYGGFIIALFGAILSFFVSRRISKPIEELESSANYLIQGDFRHRIPVSRIDEIDRLYRAIKFMAQTLHQRINTIMRQRNETEAILASMVEGVIAVDRDERIITMNAAAAKMLEADYSKAKGRSIQEAVRNSMFQEFLKETLSSKDPIEKEISLSLTGDMIVNGHGTAIFDENGKQMGALVVLNDITRLKRLENIRKEFVANVSHEIKTPITAIKGFVETLVDGSVKDDKDINRFLGIISKHVNRLEAIIDDLLRLSSIEKDAGTDGIHLRNENLMDVIQNAVQVCGQNAESKGIRIDLDCDEDLVARINPPLLEQAIVNLLDNAVKYSNENSLVKVTSYKDEKGVMIEVADQGKGIEEKHLLRLFERFYRVDKARSRQLGGTGLGLAIVKHIVQAHGGKVSVKSSPGKGSVFSILLPKIP